MNDPRCTCSPSILDPECPVKEHQEELERTADPFTYQERMTAAEEIRRLFEGGHIFLPPFHKMPPCSEFMVDVGEPTDGGCE